MHDFERGNSTLLLIKGDDAGCDARSPGNKSSEARIRGMLRKNRSLQDDPGSVSLPKANAKTNLKPIFCEELLYAKQWLPCKIPGAQPRWHWRGLVLAGIFELGNILAAIA